ncbi:metallophosphoesterase [Actinacidiphila sp. ITFR-21]|uniref:metallophosphoesterase n=1 Tax=Actinacidiphila sp. ITFR-21 TaxID=3075199 RepID=UPI00288BEAF7|nr:metallophosphoesterase [Streptomyces sp. ITFR-21]WNI18644.1 metallophosphoesterase [Streptomyces sp. ITFR-21]
MSVYQAGQSYDPALDVRLGDGWPVPNWVKPLIEARPSNGPAWLVVMPRRAGKTWLARGIEHARPAGTTARVDLRASTADSRARSHPWLSDAGASLPVEPGGLLLVDEPALAAAGLDPAVLAECLYRVHRAGVTVVVFATPAEHDLLIAHLGPDAPKDVRSAPPLDAAEQARLAARAPDWAPGTVEWLAAHDTAWLRTPFLLELALHSAEEHPGRRGEPAELLRAAAEEAIGSPYVYVEQWFHDGLSAAHRAQLRAERWRDADLPVPGARIAPHDLAGRLQLAADPVLAHHLPQVLRVHHISDLHHGGPMRANVDAKDNSPAGLKLAAMAGAGTPMDSYLHHVRQLAAQGRAPHLVVVTGDVVNLPLDEHGEVARTWLRALAGALADHRDLRPQDPRVLLVGGNHDVSWDLVRDPSPQARHRWFAANFSEYPHPDLHLADPRERRLYVTYPRLGLRFALLGTAESGGEEQGVPDPDTGPDHLDPGVVARGVLDRLSAATGFATVAALHHPLSPVPTVEVAPYSGVVNAGQAKRALSVARTSLVLHGHTHLAFFAAERLLGLSPPWTMRIAGAPALATPQTEERNGYNELFVAREGERSAFAIRTVRLDGGQWTPEQLFAFRPGAPEERALAELCGDE